MYISRTEGLEDLEKSLKSNCLTRTYKNNKSYYMNFMHENKSYIPL